MGCFDAITLPCPSCGEEIEFQTKAGKCGQLRYSLEDQIPTPIALDVAGRTKVCQNCFASIRLRVPLNIHFTRMEVDSGH